MHPKLLLLIVLIAFPYLIFSQSNYEQGTVILKNGQTIPGLINYQNWQKNPKKIEFKKSAGDQVNIYSVEDLNSFDVTGKDRYESFVVTKMIAPINALEVDKRSVYSTVIDTVFLRVLLLGDKLDLYELYDERIHFFIKQPGSTPMELQYKITLNNAVSVVRHTIYREQLKVLTDNDAIKARIENAEYVVPDITRIVKKINSSVTYMAGDAFTSKGSIKFFAGVGPMINSLDISGTNTTLNNMEFSSPMSYVLTAGVDLLGYRNFSRFRVRMEISLSQASYKGVVIEPGFFSGQMEKKEYSIKQNNVIPGFSATYSPYHSKKIDAFIGGAAGLYLSNYKDNTFTTTNLTTGSTDTKRDYLALESTWISSDIRAGVRMKNLEFVATSKVLGSFFNFEFIFGNVQVYTFRLLYNF